MKLTYCILKLRYQKGFSLIIEPFDDRAPSIPDPVSSPRVLAMIVERLTDMELLLITCLLFYFHK